MKLSTAFGLLVAISMPCGAQLPEPPLPAAAIPTGANSIVAFYKPFVPATISVRTSSSVLYGVPLIGGFVAPEIDKRRSKAITKLLQGAGFDVADSLETQLIAALQDAGLVVSPHSVPVAKRSYRWSRPLPPAPQCACYRWIDVAVHEVGFRATTEASDFRVSLILTLSVIDPGNGKIVQSSDFVLNPNLPVMMAMGPGSIRIPEPKQFGAKTFEELKSSPTNAIHDLQLAIAEAATQIATAAAESVDVNPGAAK